MPIQTEFVDVLHSQYKLCISQSPTAIRLTILCGKEGERSKINFYLDPKEFGSVAAALWECSPTKQPIKITGTPNEDTGTGIDAGAHTIKDGGSESTQHEAAAKAGGLTEAASQRTGPGAAVDAGTKNAGEERG